MKSKRVITNKEFMDRARIAIDSEERMARAISVLIEEIDKILSDGQRQQMDVITSNVINELKL